MALYRTLYAELPCGRCGQSRRTGVQFRAGNDNLEEYEAGRSVPEQTGLQVGERYEGLADWYCGECLNERKGREIQAFFETLAELVESGRLTIQSGLVFRKKLTPQRLLEIGAERTRAYETGSGQETGTFQFLEGLDLRWEGNPARQGGPAHTNLIVNANDRITVKLRFLGWDKPALLRDDLSVVMDEKGFLRVTSEKTPSMVG